MGFDKLDKRPACPVSLPARGKLQSLEKKILTPIYNGIKNSILAIWDPLTDYIDMRDAPGTYELMLSKYYPTNPNWHEDPTSKSKEPFNPHNSQEGCTGEVYFLKKYQEKNPELFKELMQIRIEYFKNLKNKN